MEITKVFISNIVNKQRTFFRTGKTLDIDFRRKMLKDLLDSIKTHETELEEALNADLGRSPMEAQLCDIAPAIAEIEDIRKHVRRWAKPERHLSGIACFPSIWTMVYKMPYGVTLVISPFNFPIYLSLVVAASSIAGGNTVILKTSSKSKACTDVLKKIISETFPEEFMTVIDGGHDVADMLLEERFDKIFYTGSPKIGSHVMEKASANLTPVALELGGETGNWCVIRKDADLKDAARKIAFFKMMNSGQICININQIAVASEVADDFLKELKEAFVSQIGESAISNLEYPHLINRGAYDKCANEADRYRDRIVFGGKGDSDSLRYEPTVIYPVRIDEPIVLHELFCPLLPVVPFEDSRIDDLMETIAQREHGLSLYVFTKDMKWAKKVMSSQQYGGGCVNEVCLHLMSKGTPFNGTGHSGMGAYHGVWGFREFTHPSTVLYGSTKFNLPLREHPYSGEKGEKKKNILKIILG